MVKIRFIQGIPVVVKIDYEPVQGGKLTFQSDVEDGTEAVLYSEDKEQILHFQNRKAEARGMELGNYRLVFPNPGNEFPIRLKLYRPEGLTGTYAMVGIGNDYEVYTWMVRMLESMDDMIQNQNDKIDSLTGYRTE